MQGPPPPVPWGLGDARPATNPPGLPLLFARQTRELNACPNKFGFTYIRPLPETSRAPKSNHHPLPKEYELSFTAPIPKLYHQ